MKPTILMVPRMPDALVERLRESYVVLGPMEQSDLVGLDLTLDIADVLYADLDCTAGAHPFLRQKVGDGKLGMKTGEGFRRWTAESAAAVRERLSTFLVQQAKTRRKS